MISFFLCLAFLVCGYFTYGKLVDNTFGPDDRETPAVAINDGVDYVVLPQWKLFLIQLLNIAGLGPIFGAMQGALWGPIVFLWITFGTTFAGGVHDYFSGMLSERNNGASISEVTGKYLGSGMKTVMRIFSVVLLVMVGTVFAVGPAGLIVELLKAKGASGAMANTAVWLGIILTYYFIATFISIDKIIGKIYPVFGICLILMAIGVILGLPMNGYHTPEIWTNFYNMHPKSNPIWSFMFITVACGAISGFHSTQSPVMARCLKSERQGHFVFYGAMVAEGIIALVWAAAGCSVYEVTGGLNTGLADILSKGQSAAIYDVCVKTMGSVGVVLAMLGVVACPITSGDTAFRSARLTLADWFKVDQASYANRLKLCVPLLGAGAFLGFGNSFGIFSYAVIWRYFSWTNQTLAMLVLWSGAMYLAMEKKNFWVCAVPATFMSAVSATYFIMAPECLGMIPFFKSNTSVAYPAGIIIAVAFLAIFMNKSKKYRTATSPLSTNEGHSKTA
jgi:carbon starvation protein CstA